MRLINLMLGRFVEGFADTDDGICVKLKNSPTLHANMVVMAIGVAPETTLAKDAGLELGIKGSTRTPTEYSRGHVEGFINIPVDELRERLSELDSSKPVYVICQSGLRSYIATRILAGNGLDCYNFAGGFRFYDAVHQEKALNKKSTPCGMEI